jgi:hypothetical protein
MPFAHDVHQFLHFVVAYAEGPVGYKASRICNRGIWKCLPDDRNALAANFAHRIRSEGMAAVLVERRCPIEQCLFRNADILREELTLEVRDVLPYAAFAVREFPVARHDVHTEQIAGPHHVGALRPQRRCRALPGITSIQEQ